MAGPFGLLLSCFDFSPVAEDEFHDWYDTEHIPERERVPGFLQCQRWLDPAGRRMSAATYDLQSVEVLRSPGYLAIGYDNNSPWTRRVGWRCIKLLRFEGSQIVPGGELPPRDAGALQIRALNIDPDSDEAFVDWYEKKHRPSLLAVAGVRCARLFRATDSTHRYVALVHIDAPELIESGRWKNTIEALWDDAFAPIARDQVRFIVRRYVRPS